MKNNVRVCEYIYIHRDNGGGSWYCNLRSGSTAKPWRRGEESESHLIMIDSEFPNPFNPITGFPK